MVVTELTVSPRLGTPSACFSSSYVRLVQPSLDGWTVRLVRARDPARRVSSSVGSVLRPTELNLICPSSPACRADRCLPGRSPLHPGQHLWNAAIVFANYLVENDEFVVGKNVLELGAAGGELPPSVYACSVTPSRLTSMIVLSALPGLVSALSGAKKVSRPDVIGSLMSDITLT